jgi:predicted Zn finger-like uncharacterized protein
MPELVNCPHCDKKLRVPDHLQGRAVKCPGCGNMFTASAGDGAPPPVAEGLAEPPLQSRRSDEEAFIERPPHRHTDDDDGQPRQSYDDDQDDEDDEEDRPRRRRKRSRRAAALQAVSVPAILLIVIGVLGIFMGIANIAVSAAGLGIAPEDRARPGFMAGRYIGSFVSLIWGIVVAAGGFKMKSLQSRGSAMTGAIVAMVPCNPCCLCGFFVGIWALVAMNNSDVRKAFE